MIIRPKSPLGLKYLQIVPGDSSEGFAAGRNDPARAPPARNRSTSTSSSTCSTRRRATRSSATRPASATPSPAAARRSTPPSAPCGAWSKAASRCCATSSPRRPTSAASGERSRTSRRRSRRSPRPRPSMFVAPRPHLRRLRPRLAPLHPGNDRQRPADASRSTIDLPALRPFLDTRPASSPRCEPGRPGARPTTSPTIAAAFARRHPGAQRLAGPERAARADRGSAARLPERPGVFNGLDLLIDTNNDPRPRHPLHRPGADDLQLPHPRLPQRRRRLQRRQRQRQLAATRSPSSRPSGPEHRGRARLGAGQRPRARQPPPLQPLPEHRVAGPGRRAARPATSTTSPGQTVIGNVAAALGHDDRGPGQQRRQLMRRLPERDTRARNETSVASSGGPSNAAIAVIFILIFTVRPLPGLHQTRALHRPRLHAQRDLRQRRQHLDQLAGADRRRRRRQGDRGRARRRRHRGHLHGRRRRAGRSTTTPSPQIRPRIFLEGNFFIDLDPGSPSAPEMDSGATIPVSHTSTAVQLDEILTALQSPVRADLSRLLESFGTALTHEPTAAEDATQLPEVKGKTGAEGLNGAFHYGGPAGPLQRPGRPTPSSAPSRTTSPASSPAPGGPSARSPAARPTSRA